MNSNERRLQCAYRRFRSFSNPFVLSSASKYSSFASLFWALGATTLWSCIGVANRESALHIEYSLGTSSRWHAWLSRGNPGEVVRHWGVPIYDQWSGLGYRLPTQGFLSNSPLAYLAKLLPINAVMFVGLVLSLWFCFSVVNSFVCSWVTFRSKILTCYVYVVLLGMMSFYTLWHGWPEYAIQIAGATVCIATLTSRDNLDSPEQVSLTVLFANLSPGFLLLNSPHPAVLE
jgi:hypothetical protein